MPITINPAWASGLLFIVTADGADGPLPVSGSVPVSGGTLLINGSASQALSVNATGHGITNQLTVIAVAQKTDDFQNYPMLLSAATAGGDGTQGFELLCTATTSKPQLSVDETSGRPYAESTVTLNNAAGEKVMIGRYNGNVGGTVDMTIDGSTVSVSANGNIVGIANTWAIGNRIEAGTALGFTGKLRCLAVYKRRFSDAERDSIAADWEQLIDEAPPPASIDITTPVDGRIHQRAGTTGTITVTGTYGGTPTSIQARLVQDGTNTPLTGFDWATKVASPTGGTFAFSFTGVPQGGWYNVQVRHSNDTAVNDISGKVGVGAQVAVLGQSNAWLWFHTASASLTPNALVRIKGSTGDWSVPDIYEMEGAITCGNALATALGIPIAILDYAVDASGLVDGGGVNWLPVSNTPSSNFKSAVAGIDGKIEAAIWIQGEADSGAGVSTANYYAGLGTLFADWRTAFSQSTLPIVLSPLARRLDGVVSDANIQTIRAAQFQKCGDVNILRVEREDIPLAADNLHHTIAGFRTLATRCAQAILYALGQVSYYRGPRIASVSQVSGTVFDVTLTHGGGSDITPSSGITGFRVLDGSTPATISSAVRQAANRVRLTLSGAPSGTVTVQYLYGRSPDVSGVLLDNSGLALPLEASNGVEVSLLWRVPTTGAPGTNVHVIVFNGSGPTYTIAAQGNATLDASGNADIVGTGVLGTKKFALVHNFNDDTNTNSIFGGPAIAILAGA